MHVLVTGATGLVGKRVVAALRNRGDAVTPMSRQARDGYLQGDPTIAGPWLETIASVDAVIHLAGAGVLDRRWTRAYKDEIYQSRVASTALIAKELAKNPRRGDGLPKVFVSASAVGYYGPTPNLCPELAPPGDDFLAKVCIDWEAAAEVAQSAGVRVVHPRLGIVLDPVGGALPRMAKPFRLFIGGPIGQGKQGVSWVHHQDLLNMILFALDTPAMTVPFNATAPLAVSNHTFSKALGRALHRPSWLPVPKFAVRVMLGDGVQVVASGQFAVPEVLQATGYRWLFPDLDQALKNVVA